MPSRCDQEVRTGGIKRLVDEEVLLLPTQVAEHFFDLGIEHPADGKSRVGNGLERLLERSLVIQGLSRI